MIEAQMLDTAAKKLAKYWNNISFDDDAVFLSPYQVAEENLGIRTIQKWKLSQMLLSRMLKQFPI